MLLVQLSENTYLLAYWSLFRIGYGLTMHCPQWQNCLNIFPAWLPWSGRPFCLHAARCCPHRSMILTIYEAMLWTELADCTTLEENAYFCSSPKSMLAQLDARRGAGLFWWGGGTVYRDGVLLLITDCQTMYFQHSRCFGYFCQLWQRQAGSGNLE